MEMITSKENKTLKYAQSLLQKKIVNLTVNIWRKGYVPLPI